MFKIRGKIALITGALGGIGQSYTKALLDNKIKGVTLVDINEATAQAFITELDQTYGPGKVLFIKVDLTDTKQIEAAFEQTVKHFKHLDIVINNAGIVDEVNIEKCIQVNLIATSVSTNLAMFKYLPAHKQGDEGVIINTSSISIFLYTEGLPTYVATKMAVMALGRCLGTPGYYETNKVRIVTIAPGGTTTSLFATVRDLPKEMYSKIDNLRRNMQSPEFLGKALIKLLQEGKNGSIWLAENSKPAFEIDYSVAEEIVVNQLEKF